MTRIWDEVDDLTQVEERVVDGRNHFAWDAVGAVGMVVTLAGRVLKGWFEGEVNAVPG